MRCPFCKLDNDKVIDSRSSSEGAAVRRRRECVACGRRYTTYERVEEQPFRVVKKDGSRVPFERARILRGLQDACKKRPVSTETLNAVVDRIEQRCTEMFDTEVSSKFIGTMVMEELKRLDPVAYVRFASVYREFKDVDEFVRELDSVKDRGRDAPGASGA
ncbi:MAG TPA: transcriptional regulator NrdR [Planctomycetota bacterium]|nr:transcriptional regulator NrdR [Planctomycetota bacterium]